jgi:Holliday junction resolvase
LEREIINILRKHGYETIRGAGSKGKLAGLCEACGGAMKIDVTASKVTNKLERTVFMVFAQMKLHTIEDG